MRSRHYHRFLPIFHLIILVLTTIGGLCAVPKQVPPVLWISIVGEDFAVLPLARYNAGRWYFDWPTVEKFDAVAPPSASESIPREQHFYPLNGRLQPITLTKPMIIASHCQRMWAFATTSAMSIFDPESNRLRDYLGLAINSDSMVVESEEELVADFPDILRKQLTVKISSLENETLAPLMKQKKNSGIQLLYPRFQVSRDSTAIDLTIYAMPLDSSNPTALRLYRFEASKKYVDFVSEENCAAYTHCYGWFAATGKNVVRFVDCECLLGDCSDDGSVVTQPLGIVVVNRDRVWAGVRALSIKEYFVMYALKSDNIVHITQRLIGGCSKAE